MIVDREARGTSRERREAFPGHKDMPEFDPLTGERIVDWQRRGGKGQVPPTQGDTGEDSSKRKYKGAVLAGTQAGKRLRQQKVDEVYGGEWVLLQKPGSSPHAVLPSHSEIASMQAVETHRAELAEELEEVRQPFWVTGATILSDGRKSRNGRPIVNFLTAGSRGVVMYTKINREGEPDDAEHVLLRWVVQLVEITANVRFTEHRRAECDYVLPWQHDEGMLDCQAGLELEPVHMGTRKGMMEEEIAQQVALIMRDPIGASAPPATDAVFARRACIFRSYPRDDESDEERAPDGVDDPALPSPREIDETHEEADDAEVRTYTARRSVCRAEREMMWGDEDFWGPFGEVASTGDVRDDRGGASHADTSRAEAGRPTPTTRQESPIPPPPAPSPAPPTPVLPVQLASTKSETEELASSLPPHGLLQRLTVVRQLWLRSPSPGVLQEEGEVAAAKQEAPTVGTAEEEVPVQATTEEEVAAAAMEREEEVAREGDIAAAVEREEEVAAVAILASIPMDHDGADAEDNLMQLFIVEDLDPVVGGLTPGVAMELGIFPPTGGAGSEMGTHFDFDMSMGGPPSCSGATSTDRVSSRHDGAGETGTQTPRERTEAASPDTARDIMERERARLMASSNPRAQAFAHALEEARHRETGEVGVQGGVVAREDVMEGVRAEVDDEAMQGGPEAVDVPVEGGPQAVDEAVHAGQGRDEGAGDARPVVQTVTGPVVPFSALHLAEGRWSQLVQVAVHGLPPLVIMDLGSEPTLEPPRPRTHFAPQEVCRPLDAKELARDVVRDVTRLDRRIFERRLEQPPWQAIPSVPWGSASPVWSGSTSSGGRTLGDVPGVSGACRSQRHTPRKRGVPPHPRPVAAEGGGTFGESSGADGLGMPHGSRREKTVAEASAKVVLLRKGGGPVTIKKDDPETVPAVREEDEDCEGEEESVEESESRDGGDENDDDD
ncbi:hypothetical protein CBR_g36709 [Chara braunii]|uniref:Uncharacterized protein n=1 Tax=Chara braunii TaxID=69332 RepID=A0A388LLF9_CHABU|nr:hypothetical protein CBR_g36709 [Chara braunii]|eukprot:GBG83091.1 hypothetical protein CBR_g36709 [Chara braunii]